MVTHEEYLADLEAVHLALDAIVATLSKIEHALAASDARVRDGAIKDVSQFLETAITAVGTLNAHMRMAKLMVDLDMTDSEREIFARRLGCEDETDEDEDGS
jgi:hypothetical protein